MSTQPVSPETLRTETPDNTPDSGPRQHAGAIGVVLTIIALLAAGTLSLLCRENEPAAPWFWVPLAVLGAPGLFGLWRIIAEYRGRVATPASQSVLSGELGFDILCTCRGVAATTFFQPDALVPGGTARLLLFLENYTSRQRVIVARFGHLESLGRPRQTYARLHLAAGQTAVYALPVVSTEDIEPGFHRLSVTLRAELPTGYGQRLAGARRHAHDMLTVRFAAPFEVKTPPVTAAAAPADAPGQAAAPRYIALSSAGKPDVHEAPARLHALVTGAPVPQ
ncbi:MAG: hypothetical protein LBR12_06100 [Opitutaceae bacterium]|jgi:hypothetical protein|nr:hypothetical protein [Opitutaceae bacterium]